ncbi:hypothetical protein NDU88_009372 [Pleurodeles waltl]|uniref:Uncharacterized protein n=1 Tax=Pleurodeles waltl TaxID=8319 RepID=A0AAV7QXD7_PLEWA|nr:hypothetical protein NDU88_009372 [Pleurodeles waltl]
MNHRGSGAGEIAPSISQGPDFISVMSSRRGPRGTSRIDGAGGSSHSPAPPRPGEEVGRSPRPVFALQGILWCPSGLRIRPSLSAARAPLRIGIALSPLLSAGARASLSRGC